MRLSTPRQAGFVRLKEPLGEGGMALVFRGEDPLKPAAGLAVKLLRPEVHGDAELVKRFLREGEVLVSLRHPHIVEVYSFGMAGAWPYLVMELLPGGDFKACLGEAPARVVARLATVASALETAHLAGVIHRDLKPSNLLFAADGRLKVTDFGVCLWEGGEGTRVTRSQMVVGTLGYMAPEQHGDPRRVDGRCDIFALGAILYEFTTGQAWAQVQLPPAAARPGYPPKLARIILQMLAPDPAKRMPRMEAVEGELRAWLDSAEAAGWGSEPLPGWGGDREDQPTQARSNPRREESPGDRLQPYVEALRTGAVGSRRAAAEGLLRQARPEDEAFLLEVLRSLPESARFALVQVLGAIGGAPALAVVLALLEDPFARGDAADAASRIALRVGQGEAALAQLRESGLGSTWRWAARARLADASWAEALPRAWQTLPTPQRLQALEAAKSLPEGLRQQIKSGLQPWIDAAGPSLRELWQQL
jgi:hypothetical protein